MESQGLLTAEAFYGETRGVVQRVRLSCCLDHCSGLGSGLKYGGRVAISFGLELLGAPSQARVVSCVMDSNR